MWTVEEQSDDQSVSDVVWKDYTIKDILGKRILYRHDALPDMRDAVEGRVMEISPNFMYMRIYDDWHHIDTIKLINILPERPKFNVQVS